MKRQDVLTSVGFCILLLAAQKVAAQSTNCAPHDAVVARLAAQYGESRQVIALAANNTVVEVFASATSGTWSITLTQAGGPTCLVAAGDNYQYLAEELINTDDPA